MIIRDAAIILLEVEVEIGCYTLAAKNKQYWQEAYYVLAGERKDKVPSTNTMNYLC